MQNVSGSFLNVLDISMLVHGAHTQTVTVAYFVRGRITPITVVTSMIYTAETYKLYRLIYLRTLSKVAAKYFKICSFSGGWTRHGCGVRRWWQIRTSRQVQHVVLSPAVRMLMQLWKVSSNRSNYKIIKFQQCLKYVSFMVQMSWHGMAPILVLESQPY